MAFYHPRIAMLSVHSCPMGNPGTRDTGGMSIYVREIARQLGKLGICVDIYTRAHQPDERPLIEPGNNARLIHLGAGDGKEIPKLEFYHHLPEFVHNLERFRNRNNIRYDLVFSHYWLSGVAGEFLAEKWGVPHCLMFHTEGAAKNSIGIGEAEPRLRLETEKRLAESCSLIITATEKERDDLIRYYDAPRQNIAVIPCGVNIELFRPLNEVRIKKSLARNERKTALFAGRIEPLKGLDRLLKAMAYLKNGQRPRLIIIGGDEYSRSEVGLLRTLCRELNISDSVIFIGMVRHQELPFYYNAADVCVIPSYYETFGLVALEAIACGTPVVATDVGGAGSFIQKGETGSIVKSNEPRLLAEAIYANLYRPDSKKCINSFRASVMPFDWSNIARRVIRQFEYLLPEWKGDYDG